MKRHKEWHVMNEQGLKFHCKECNKNFAIEENFFSHVKRVHTNRKIEPVIVLDEHKDLTNPQQNVNINTGEKDENLKSARTFNAIPKPKKGKWIVKLERLKNI